MPPFPKGTSHGSTSEADTSFLLNRTNTAPRKQPTSRKIILSGSGEGETVTADLGIQPKDSRKKDAEKGYNNSEIFHFFQRTLWLEDFSHLCNFTPLSACCRSSILSLLKREAEQTEGQQKTPLKHPNSPLSSFQESNKEPHSRNDPFHLLPHSCLRSNGFILVTPQLLIASLPSTLPQDCPMHSVHVRSSK